MKYWIEKGAPKDKITLGMGTYGHTFKLQDPSENSVGSPITGAAGGLGYNKVNNNFKGLGQMMTDSVTDHNAL